MYTFNAIPIKLPVAFSETLNKIFQCVWRHKRPQIAKEILRKESGGGGFITSSSDGTTELRSSKQYDILARK